MLVNEKDMEITYLQKANSLILIEPVEEQDGDIKCGINRAEMCQRPAKYWLTVGKFETGCCAKCAEKYKIKDMDVDNTYFFLGVFKSKRKHEKENDKGGDVAL
jgi:hypothetical protein